MTETLRPGDAQTARERLFAAAIEVFNRNGYAGSSVREIVEAAGVTKPVLYYYFGSKDGIYLELLREALLQFRATLASVRNAQGTVRERIKALSLATIELLRSNPGVVRLIHAVFYGPHHGAPEFEVEAFHEAFYGAMRELIVEGIQSGEVRPGDVDEFTVALIGATNTCSEMELAGLSCTVGPEAIARVIDVVFDGIGATTPRI